jgi:hypothetical protein
MFWEVESNITGGSPVRMLPSTTSCFSYPGMSIFTSFVQEKSTKTLSKMVKYFILKFKIPSNARDNWEQRHLFYG